MNAENKFSPETSLSESKPTEEPKKVEKETPKDPEKKLVRGKIIKFFASKKPLFETKKEYLPFQVSDNVPNGSFVMVMFLPNLVDNVSDKKHTEKNEGWGYTSGWNGSYHDAYYTPILYAWAKGRKKPKFRRARQMLKEAPTWLDSQRAKDPTVARFEARRQVRGDCCQRCFLVQNLMFEAK